MTLDLGVCVATLCPCPDLVYREYGHRSWRWWFRDADTCYNMYRTLSSNKIYQLQYSDDGYNTYLAYSDDVQHTYIHIPIIKLNGFLQFWNGEMTANDFCML